MLAGCKTSLKDFEVEYRLRPNPKCQIETLMSQS